MSKQSAGEAAASVPKRDLVEQLTGALRFIMAFYEPGQTYLDTEAWKQAEAGGRRALARGEAYLAAPTPSSAQEQDHAAPQPGQDAVERACRAMMGVSRPNANPDDLTPAPRGISGLIPKWRLFEHLAAAALRAAQSPAVQTDGEREDARQHLQTHVENYDRMVELHGLKSAEADRAARLIQNAAKELLRFKRQSATGEEA